MKLNRYLIYKINRILKFGIFSLIVFFLMIQFVAETSFQYPQLFFSFFYGIVIGLVFENTNNIRFYSKPFLLRNTIRLSILVIALLLIIALLRVFFNGFVKDIDNDGFLPFLWSTDFINLIIPVFIITFFIVLFIELEKHLGGLFIWDFFFSKYKKPIEENRIIMFLDLKDSTSIAERVGNQKFVEFINLCYSVMTKPLIMHKATILKYVGDEVILTWPIEKGIKNSKCINFYFDYNSELERHKEEFGNKFGFVPVFKAGVHSGMVTAAFLGTVKKQMDYSGDVMNTTARIQSICNQYDADLLISSELFSILPNDSKFRYSKIGDIELKGKEFKVGVQRVELTENF